MRLFAATALALLIAPALPAEAQQLRIGLAAPLSGASERLGVQMRQGAEAAAAAFAQGQVELVTVDDGCTAEGGAAAARQFVEQKVAVVTGFLCTESIQAAMPVLSEAGIAVVTPAVRTDSLTDQRERTGWPVYRFAPRADDEREAVASILTRRWREALFAIIDDGTIYGRELSESFRLAAEQAGLKPVFVDTFRPGLDNQIGLAGRLRRAGATHVFVGGDRSDIAILARDARTMDFDLTIAGGEALRAAPADIPLENGVLMVGLPEWSEAASPQVLEFLASRQVLPEGYVLPAYAALEIAASAALASQGAGSNATAVLDTRTFNTALGAVAFDAKGDAKRDFYRLFEYRDGAFVEVK
jgi:branched-chain amino acid transport system substrate-binding protein